jgi:hypothetical protein
MISDPDQKIGRPRQLYTGRRAARVHADRSASLTLAPAVPPRYR